MAVRIRLLRMGKIRNPQYRVVIADSRKKRDGRTIENIGLYHPKEDPSRIEVNSERVQYWLSVGAQPSEPVVALLKRTGDWQKFKGLQPPSKPLQVAAPRVDQKAAYDAEAKAAAGLAEKADKASRAEKAAKGDRAPAKKAAKKAAKPAAAEAEPAQPEAAKTEDEAAKPPAEAPKPEAAQPEPAQPEPEAAKNEATSGEKA